MIQIDKNKNGYAILELLFYIAFFALLSIVTINAMIAMAQSFKETEVQTSLLRSGAIMERISREIRLADSINLISASSLKLNTTDSSGNAKTVQFSLSGANAQFFENDALTGNLNAPDIIVSSLTFTEITTTEGKGIKVILTVQSENDKYSRAVDFYDTVVLRGNY
ncbi:hypothetical protein HYW73_00680 [Candidatus Nomurabacteria bacterium]|nr:hypothetical protein [Candidatus Nomurabacteria bacterium]